VKVLVLGNSANDQPGLAVDDFWHAIASREVEARTGEPVELVLRRAWPNERFPSIVERWIAEERPDIVYLTVIAFWYCYESVPLRIERRFGRAGKPIRNAGIRVSKVPWFAHNRVFHAARQAVTRAIGGDTFFSEEQVIEQVGKTLRTAIRDESVVVAVRGPGVMGPYLSTPGMRRRALPRRTRVDAALRKLCAELHVEYQGLGDVAPEAADGFSAARDRVHMDADSHRRVAEAHVELLERAWRRLAESRR
jgi:hypothetical protein